MMAFKKTLPFLLAFSLLIYKTGAAQQVSIVPDLSDVYVEKLVNIAKNYYPKVKSGQNHINVANDILRKNRAAFWEILTATYIYQPNQNAQVNPVSPATSYFKGYQVGLFLNLGTLLEHPFIVKQSREELQIAVNDRDEYLITLTTLVKKRYYLFLQAQANLKIQIKTLQDNDSILKDIRYKFEKGEVTFDIYNQAIISNSTQQISKVGAEAALFAARADVEELLGTKIENIK
jgi:outer membrane protein TolC